MSRRYPETGLGHGCSGHQVTSADWLGVKSSTNGSVMLQPTVVCFDRTADGQTWTFRGFDGRTSFFTGGVGQYISGELVNESGNWAAAPAKNACTNFGDRPAPNSLSGLGDLQAKSRTVFDGICGVVRAAISPRTEVRTIDAAPSPSGVLFTAPASSSVDIFSSQGERLTKLDPGISYDATTKTLDIFAVLPTRLDAAGNVHQMSQAIPLAKGGQLEERHWRFMLESRPETGLGRLRQLMLDGEYTTCVMAVRTGLAAVLDEVSQGLREDLYTGVTDLHVGSYRLPPPRGFIRQTGTWHHDFGM